MISSLIGLSSGERSSSMTGVTKLNSKASEIGMMSVKRLIMKAIWDGAMLYSGKENNVPRKGAGVMMGGGAGGRGQVGTLAELEVDIWKIVDSLREEDKSLSMVNS